MNNKASNEFGFRRIRRIKQISDGVIRPRQCPLDRRPHYSGAGYLSFEQKLTSFYEARELS